MRTYIGHTLDSTFSVKLVVLRNSTPRSLIVNPLPRSPLHSWSSLAHLSPLLPSPELSSCPSQLPPPQAVPYRLTSILPQTSVIAIAHDTGRRRTGSNPPSGSLSAQLDDRHRPSLCTATAYSPSHAAPRATAHPQPSASPSRTTCLPARGDARCVGHLSAPYHLLRPNSPKLVQPPLPPNANQARHIVRRVHLWPLPRELASLVDQNARLVNVLRPAAVKQGEHEGSRPACRADDLLGLAWGEAREDVLQDAAGDCG